MKVMRGILEISEILGGKLDICRKFFYHQSILFNAAHQITTLLPVILTNFVIAMPLITPSVRIGSESVGSSPTAETGI
jgi:hypothetical protein